MAEQVCTIGKNIIIRGNLSGAEDIAVEGRVEGTINLANQLTVEPSGVVEADLEVDDVVVRGTLHGNVHASRVITLNPDSKVTGMLQAPCVIIEDGARFNGRVEMEVQLPEGLDTK
jgi:cytoskeletal protein CcmA (bactofilin family)